MKQYSTRGRCFSSCHERGKRKSSESPWGIEPQTFGFRAPMLYHWATEISRWGRCITINDSISLIKLQKATGKQCKLFTSVSIEQENKRRTTHLHFLITVVSNSVRTVSFAYSGKVEKNFRLNKPYISVSMEQEENRQRSCFHAISNYLGIRLENAAIARSEKL